MMAPSVVIKDGMNWAVCQIFLPECCCPWRIRKSTQPISPGVVDRTRSQRKQVPPAYTKPFRQGHKNDFRDAQAVTKAVQRPTRCVPAKTDDQLDLKALPHSITSSARASSIGGTSMPSAFAVSRLMTKSNLVDCMAGEVGSLGVRRTHLGAPGGQFLRATRHSSRFGHVGGVSADPPTAAGKRTSKKRW